MKYFKKILCLMVCFAFSFALCACIDDVGDESNTGSLVIVGEVTPTVEKILDSYSVSLSGTVQNTSSKNYSYVSITFQLYDDEGSVLGTSMDNVNDLQAGATWKFKTVGFVNSGNPTQFRLIELSGF